jgi:hypothetical protein
MPTDRHPHLVADPLRVVLLPRCTGTQPDTVCATLGCTALLTYVCGTWLHLDTCRECLTGGPCREPHRACDDAQPVTCVHGCDWNCHEPVQLANQCAHGHPEWSCCSCCWATPDVPKETYPCRSL